MMTATPLESAERIHADHATVKHLGHWTEATEFDVRARRATVVLDLRSPRIGWGEPVSVRLELLSAAVTLLLPEDVAVDSWDLAFTRRGRVKDAQPGTGPALLRLAGVVTDGEIRIRRGGTAQLTAMCSRAYLDDLRRAHREGGLPVVDDPTRERTH
ncbi:hypothetical protein [Streptomyces roseochromogenus]|uniref:Uncharacterized protein n=1 Tax=Streptomyces roseochromogenus subsp. oscitans DS 12.976 TaxID=1352936 RepID=V6JH47_STRRC|nr:hypothetical protein [Streptomyces roseochromogenus]EST19053.1 hypothetical protein M878_43080 [Streptomyces roseochromogenus subsp. oscitans DS 12.976]